MRKVYSIAVVTALGLIFQGCGLKGPLRLPDRAKPVGTESPTTPATSVPAPPAATDKPDGP